MAGLSFEIREENRDYSAKILTVIRRLGERRFDLPLVKVNVIHSHLYELFSSLYL
jgi:hypothetical protein